MKSMKRIPGWSALAIGATLIAGCATSSPDDVSYTSISHDLSPELRGLTERPIDANRNMNVTADVNSRMAEDDWSRLWHIDHPSRLSPFPISGTSGMPR